MQRMIWQSLLLSGMCMSGCGTAPLESPSSQAKFDIDIPTGGIDPTDIREILGGISEYVHEGSQQVLLTDFFAKLKVDGGFKTTLDQISSTREPHATVTCVERKCKILNVGNESSFKIDGANIPILGNPSVTLGQKIEIVAQLSEDLQRFEACRISGVRVGSGFLHPSLDGVLLELGADALKALKVDADLGGSYPSRSCDF